MPHPGTMSFPDRIKRDMPLADIYLEYIGKGKFGDRRYEDATLSSALSEKRGVPGIVVRNNEGPFAPSLFLDEFLDETFGGDAKADNVLLLEFNGAADLEEKLLSRSVSDVLDVAIRKMGARLRGQNSPYASHLPQRYLR